MKDWDWFAILFFISGISFSQSFFVRLDSVTILKGASVRGMSVVDDSVAWICGSKGTVARTMNGGKTWEKIEVKGFEKNDFRSVEAFDRNFAYIATTSEPAALLITKDGGKTWNTLAQEEKKGTFFDALCCWDRAYCILLADPLERKFVLAKYIDGNFNLTDTAGPSSYEGESCFAASGTCLRIDKRGRVWFVTGGTKSRMFYSRNYGKDWTIFDLPLISGKSSQGAFSIALRDDKNAIVVGGNYTEAKSSVKNCAITKNGGKSWILPDVPPGGYRSCVEYISGKTFIATGTTGSDVTTDGGITWKNFDGNNFNVVRKAKRGKLILMAGDRGMVGRVTVSEH